MSTYVTYDEMESNAANKLLTPSLCRCCLTDDCYKDISTEYFWMGKREVYADMLLETFDINISQTKFEDISNSSRMICEHCIAQLRGAAAFKQQVIHCEKVFQDHLNTQKSDSQSLLSDPLEDLKRKSEDCEDIKIDFDIIGHENDDNYDDVDDEPLMNLTSKNSKIIVKSEPTVKLSQKRQNSSVLIPPPIKRIKIPDKTMASLNSKRIVTKAPPSKVQPRMLTSGMLNKISINQQLISKLNKVVSLQEGLKRSAGKSVPRLISSKVNQPSIADKRPFRTANVGRKIMFKNPTGQPHIKPSTSTTTPLVNPKKEHKTSNSNEDSTRHNAELIIRYSTTYPFKLPEENMMCVYCGHIINVPSKYRDHMETNHPEVKLKRRIRFLNVGLGSVKVDISDLRCRICFEAFETLNAVALHLRDAHGKTFNLDCELGLQPYKFIGDLLRCTVCNHTFHTLRSLSRHTQSHFSKFPCETCGKLYSSQHNLKKHITDTHSSEGIRCIKCKKTFESYEVRRQHLEESIRCRRHICNFCGDKFISWTAKQSHLSEKHQETQAYSCPECGESFTGKMKLRSHFHKMHDKSNSCQICNKGFRDKRHLGHHMVVHTKEKKFQCTVCEKFFTTRHVLHQHMVIHCEERKLVCKECGKKFNQRVTWKTHMKSYHPEVVDVGLINGNKTV